MGCWLVSGVVDNGLPLATVEVDFGNQLVVPSAMTEHFNLEGGSVVVVVVAVLHP
jgi:bifunctional DNA-binding transcriptional regulator/antitoxin component of YhaV-PrlF toxin-antitoxin module